MTQSVLDNVAELLATPDTGLPGWFADLVVFDPQTVRDCATYAEPIAPSEGIAQVWVNGQRSFHRGDASGQRAGRLLRRAA